MGILETLRSEAVEPSLTLTLSKSMCRGDMNVLLLYITGWGTTPNNIEAFHEGDLLRANHAFDLRKMSQDATQLSGIGAPIKSLSSNDINAYALIAKRYVPRFNEATRFAPLVLDVCRPTPVDKDISTYRDLLAVLQQMSEQELDGSVVVWDEITRQYRRAPQMGMSAYNHPLTRNQYVLVAET